MADYNVVFYNINTTGTFSTTVGGTYDYAGPATATGSGVITDNEAGVGGQNLDDDNNGGELATATVTVGGLTSTDSTVDAEISWTVRDTVTGEEFEVVQFQVELGDAVGSYVMSEIPLVVGRTYETLAYDTNPNADAGAPAFNYADHATSDFFGSDGTVSGTAGDDIIDTDYFDTDFDAVSDGNDIVEAGAGNDIIDAGDGDDTIDAGTGNDTVLAGLGNDSIIAGDGDDTITAGGGDDSIDAGIGNDFIVGDQTYGLDGQDTIDGGAGDDTIYGDSVEPSTGDRTTDFSWADQGVADETSITGGVTGLTGNGEIQVSLSVATEANFTSATMETNDTLYDYNGLSDTSSLEVFGGAAGTSPDAATLTIDFEDPANANAAIDLENVTFGIFDIDELDGQFIDQVIITAYDANGVQVPVTITIGSGTTLTTSTDANGTATAESIVNSGGSGQVNAVTGFIQVTIPGPVSSIEIDYNNTDPVAGNHAIRIGDLEMTVPNSTTDGAADSITGGTGDDLIYGQGGDDTIDGGADSDSVYGGTGNDTITDSGTTSDYIEGGSGDDEINAGDGADTVYGGTGADSVFGEGGSDTLFGGAGDDYLDGDGGNDTIFGGADNDTLVGDAGTDSLYGGTGDDEIYASSGDNIAEGGIGNDSIFMGTDNDSISGGDGSDILSGGAGNDIIDGDIGDDTLTGGDGNDTLTAGTGNDSINGGQGSDQIILGEGFGTDTINGTDDAGDTDIDVLDASSMTSDIVLNLSSPDPEAGILTSGGNTATFDNIETVTLGSGDDNIIGSAGDDSVTAGTGADTINMGAGNDTVDLGAGSPDGDADIIILQDGFGNDTIGSFDAPTPNGDGTFTGIDTLDTTNLFDLPLGDPDRTPVMTNDVVVTDDGAGNALLTFPNGETITLEGISPTDADDPFYLNAIGIPMPDGTVEGTAGDDTIDGSYTGDPDGDMVDGDDAILAGDTVNDDLIYGYAGNDDITAGDGNDEVYGGTGNDTLDGGDGNDTLFGGTGDDTFTVSADDDTTTITGGEDLGNGDNDAIDFSDGSTNQGVTVTATGAEEGTFTFDGSAGVGSYSEIEEISGTFYDDTINLSADNTGVSIDANQGDDVITTGSGDDVIEAGTGADTINSGAGNDTISMGNNATPDGDADVIILQDGFGDDVVEGFDAPTPNGDGTFTGIDTLDTTGLFDLPLGDPARTPVMTNDVVVTDDGAGNALLTFPNGETITLNGISPTDADNPFYLNAIGIPMPDGTVSGTAGDDIIDGSYLGDPDGDIVDNDDAIIPGHSINDDLIEAGAGNDTIYAGAGNDTVYAGTGDDNITSSAGDDTIFGEAGNDFISAGSGNDVIDAGVGNDIIFGGTGTDSIDGGDGNDIINGGTDADTLEGGSGADRFVLEASFGNDTITGGEAGTDSDTIWSTQGIDTTTILTGNEAGTITDGTSTATFSEIEVIDLGVGNDTVDASASNADVTVYGDDGNDTIIGTTANDTIYGGNDSDTIDGGTGADTIEGGFGDDTIVVNNSFGDDTIIGGESAETNGDNIDGSGLTQDVSVTFTGAEAGGINNGTDTATLSQIEQVETGSGDDTITGAAGNQNVITGAGDDTITTTGTGADTISTGAGNDTITFSEADSIDGGTGDDTFTFEDLGEPTDGTITIVGGSSGETLDDTNPATLEGDTLNLGFDADFSTLNITSTTTNVDGNTSYAGSIEMDDGTLLEFSEIENIICFTPGTRIATPRGARDIATLQVGDLVVTRDHGLQPIRWIQSRTVPAMDRFAPIRIKPGVVTGQDRDLLVSPQHRMMFQGYRAELLFGESEVLVAAKHLVDGKLVTQDEGGEVTYIHMMFDEHEVVYAEGAATESFHPGSVGLSAVTDAAREELFALFPQLRSNIGGYGQTARRCLRRHEANLLHV